MATINVKLQDGSVQPMSYPDGWTDEQVQNAIYKHFPPADSNKGAELSVPRTGLGGVGEDVKESLYNFPHAFKEMLFSLPGEAAGVGRQVTHDPLRAFLQFGGGLRKGMEGIINTPANISEYMASRDLGRGKIQDVIRKIRIPESDLEQRLLGDKQAGDELLGFAGGFAPYAISGGAGLAAKGASSLAKQMAKNAGLSAAYAVGQNEDPLTAALMSASLEGGMHGIASLNPVSRLRGGLSPDELAANLLAARGTNTPLGRVIESPALSTTFENATSQIPLTGGQSKLAKVKNQIESEAARNLAITRPEDISGDLNLELKKHLTDAFRKNRKLKNEIYKERDEIANKEMFNPDLTNFNRLASQLKEGIQGSAFYSIDPVFKSLFNRVSGLERASDVATQGKPLRLGNEELMQKGTIVSPTITEATMLEGQLREKGEKLLRSTSARDKAAGGLYMDLSTQLKNDLESSIKNKGSDKLREAHQKAKKNYKENYLPFLDEDIQGTLNKENAESLISEIVKPSKAYDRAETIKNINKLLPANRQHLMGHHYLSRAMDEFGQVDPKQLSLLISSLGKRQFKALFPSKTIQESLKRFSRLRGMNEEALNLMYNPKTGARNWKMLAATLTAAIRPEAAAGIFLGSGAFNKLMTSPKVREMLVKAMLNREGYDISKLGGNKSSPVSGSPANPMTGFPAISEQNQLPSMMGEE